MTSMIGGGRRATASTESSSTSFGAMGVGFVGGTIAGFGGSFSNFLVEAVTQAKAALATAQVITQTGN
jgi:hypothetical protein